MTREPKLEPYWWEAAPLVDTDRQPLPERADVAVVGSGFTGLSAALVLARSGRSVVILEKDRPGEGASSRIGGLISAVVKMGFSKLIKVHGVERAKAIHGEGKEARKELAEFLEENGIECHFRLAGRFLGASRPHHYDRIAREADFLNKNLDIGAWMVSRAEQHGELGTDHYHGGVIFPDVGCVHPALMHKGMLDLVEKSGATVHARTPVSAIQRDGDGFTVRTARGDVSAREVIVTTNGYSGSAIPWLQRRIIPIPSQMIATEPLGPALMDRLMPKRRVVGETRNLYHYYRPSPDDTRILFGGKATSDPVTSIGLLRNDLVEIFPDLRDRRIIHAWWGNTGFTFDFLPKLVVNEGIHYAAGYNGSGVVWGYWLGTKVAYRRLGRPEAKTVFDEARFPTRPLYSGRPWFMPAVFAWYGFMDRLGR